MRPLAVTKDSRPATVIRRATASRVPMWQTMRRDATATMAVGGETSEPEAAVELEAVVAEWQDKYLRLQAEFDNYRKRTLREKMDLVQTGGRDVLLAMLPVRDDVQRALAAMEKSDDVEALRSGVLLISQKFTEALRQKGRHGDRGQGQGFRRGVLRGRGPASRPERRRRARSSTSFRRATCWASGCFASPKSL